MSEQKVTKYVYTDEIGTPIFAKERLEPGFGGAKKSFVQYALDEKGLPIYDEIGNKIGLDGLPKVLYNLSEVSKPENDKITFVEGEKDVETLRKLNFCATTTNTGANSQIAPEYAEQLRGKTVYIIPDNDPQGYGFARNFGSFFKENGIVVFYFNWHNTTNDFYSPNSACSKFIGGVLKKGGDVTGLLNFAYKYDKNVNFEDVINELLKSTSTTFLNPYEKEVREKSGSSKEIAEEWDEIIPLESEELEQFPSDVLPPKLTEYFYTLCEKYGIEYLQMPFGYWLGIMGGILQDKIKIVVNENWDSTKKHK